MRDSTEPRLTPNTQVEVESQKQEQKQTNSPTKTEINKLKLNRSTNALTHRSQTGPLRSFDAAAMEDARRDKRVQPSRHRAPAALQVLANLFHLAHAVDSISCGRLALSQPAGWPRDCQSTASRDGEQMSDGRAPGVGTPATRPTSTAPSTAKPAPPAPSARPAPVASPTPHVPPAMPPTRTAPAPGPGTSRTPPPPPPRWSRRSVRLRPRGGRGGGGVGERSGAGGAGVGGGSGRGGRGARCSNGYINCVRNVRGSGHHNVRCGGHHNVGNGPANGGCREGPSGSGGVARRGGGGGPGGRGRGGGEGGGRERGGAARGRRGALRMWLGNLADWWTGRRALREHSRTQEDPMEAVNLLDDDGNETEVEECLRTNR